MKTLNVNENIKEIVELDELIFDNSIELNSDGTLDTLIEKIGDSKYVLLGEASYGAHEYYTIRAQISKRLITEKNFHSLQSKVIGQIAI